MPKENTVHERRRDGGRHSGDVWKGLAAGAVSGLAAAAVMNQFQGLWAKLIEGEESSHGAQSLQHGTPSHGVGRELEGRGSNQDQDDAAERTASFVSETAFEHRLTKSEKEAAGTAVHYAFGVGSGALYGALAEALPQVTAGAGLPFGAVVWLTADEGVVPLLGLSKTPAEYPLKTHAYAFASHLVFGLTAEMVRRAVRNAL
jgi:hypothetical protein